MTKIDVNKVQKCYYCGDSIESLDDLVIKKYPMATKKGIRQYNRKLHTDCLLKYNDKVKDGDLKQAENSDWDDVYEYFRKDILGIDIKTPLDQHTVKRLLGLRLGTFYPSANNVRVLPRGYDFKTILYTLKFIKHKVTPLLSNSQFTDASHKTNFVMKFVVGEINDVYTRVQAQIKTNEKLIKDVAQVEKHDYHADFVRPERVKSTGKDNISKLMGD